MLPLKQGHTLFQSPEKTRGRGPDEEENQAPSGVNNKGEVCPSCGASHECARGWKYILTPLAHSRREPSFSVFHLWPTWLFSKGVPAHGVLMGQCIQRHPDAWERDAGVVYHSHTAKQGGHMGPGRHWVQEDIGEES